jgi:hypothetical protein
MAYLRHDASRELLRSFGEDEIAIGSLRKALSFIAGVYSFGTEDYRNLTGLGMRFQASQHEEAIHFRQVDVEENEAQAFLQAESPWSGEEQV